ncbi:DUF4232 domain-containing protein [Streptomyces sp. NPDC102467]|uniref:DUF4232 domain-containing protein n=1 Tax=Streptomyces sp. NPDC102467 TaxID=3366179 RepID=UPI00382BA2EF
MNSNRTSRTRLVTAAATVALAAFSLTACNDGSGVKDEGASAASSASSDPSAATPSATDAESAPSGSKGTSPKPDARSAASKSTSPKPAASGAGSKPAASGKRAVCDGSNTRTTAAPVNRPVNHMLLTVTNTGTGLCDLYYYPAVKFSEAQSVPPVIEDSKPQAVVTLAPGESGYAGVALAATDGSGSNGYTAKSLSLYFADSKGHADYNGRSAQPALPAKGVYLDDSIKVTYWQQSMDSALTW